MEFQGGLSARPLPGSDVLKIAPLFNADVSFRSEEIEPYYIQGGNRKYLNNAAYDQYLHINKVVVGEAGADQLLLLGGQLEQEDLPEYLDAAGWAYAEAALASHYSATDRIGLVEKAESIWRRSIINTGAIARTLGPEYRYGENEGHRTALNLAVTPLIKSLVVGNVRKSIIEKVLLDTAEIGLDSKLSLDRAYQNEDVEAAAYHRGFLFEVAALVALLYMDDPRYVPLPATARGDTGYYHREQTHDISIINHHWGEVRKVIPIEIKSKASRGDKRRYKALIIPGKMRLSIEGPDPRDTVMAFYQAVHKTAATRQEAGVERLCAQLREMIRLYQKGMTVEELAMNSLTRFYDSKTVARFYPELS